MAIAWETSRSVDGRTTTYWPSGAVSRDLQGVFRDFKGKVIPVSKAQANVGLDSAPTPTTAKRKQSTDTSVEDALIAKLFPHLLRLVAEQAAQADPVGNDNSDYADANSFYKTEKERWAKSCKINAERRSLSGQYQPVNSAARALARKAS